MMRSAALILALTAPKAMAQDAAACAADVTADGFVGVDDMLQMLASYGTTGCSTDVSGCPSGGGDTAGAIYISSFNEFCSGALPSGVTALREQSKCWVCEDTIRAYIGQMQSGADLWLPPAGTNFSPDPSVSFTLGYDFFIFGYDADGNYQGTPGWNDAGLGGWPPAYVGDCNSGYTEDLTACQATIGGTYTVPAQSCMDLCGAATCDDSCREHYSVHDQQETAGGTTFYSEKVEHQYELTAMATGGAFFHGYFLDSYGLLGETVYTQPDGMGGFMSCSFTDFPWEQGNTAATLAAEAAATASASIYVASFNEFCSGALPGDVSADYLREQSKCWICEDIITAYVNDMSYLPPAGTNFSPDSNVQHILGFDFFIFGYDADGNYQGTPGWNDAGLGGWPPAYVGDCNSGYNEDLSACQAAVGGTYTVPAQTCMDLCGAATCDDSCREHYTSHDQEVTGGGTTFYSEKVEHQYELTAKATNGAFFHGYFLDAYGLLGETIYTRPDGAGGFMSCAFNDYPWEQGNTAGQMAAEAAATSAASIYVASFNQFCSGALPDGVTALRQQSKCWICEDIITAYVNDMSYLPPAGTNFSPDSSVQHILGFDMFVFGYDADGNYQGTPGWNDAGLGGWPPAYVGDCNSGYNEDLSACQAAVGGTYTVPAQACMDLCGAATCDDSCREHYTSHDQEVTGGGTTFYSEKVEHQYELTAKATNGAFFHGYFLDSYGLLGETIYTRPDGAGGFMSCAFNDYPWEKANAAAAAAAESMATAAASIYVSSFNEFCSGALPDGVTAIREQTKCWICEDVVRAYINSMSGTPYLPPAGTNFSPITDLTFTLGYDFFVFGYDADGNYQGTPGWNDAGLGGWPPAYTGDCNTGYNEDMSACQAAVGGTYTVPAQSCMELCSAASCGDESCREHYSVHDELETEGGTTFYSEKVEHQYELTAKATAGAFFHGYFLDSIGLLGETVYTQPDGAGGFMSCSFTDYAWEVAIDLPTKLEAMQTSLDTLVAAGR